MILGWMDVLKGVFFGWWGLVWGDIVVDDDVFWLSALKFCVIVEVFLTKSEALC